MASSSRDTRLSEQYAINRSMDLTFDKLGVVVMGYDGANIHRIKTNSSGELILSNITLEGIGVFDSHEQETGSITQADTSLTFTQEVKSSHIENIGSNACYINFDAAATTSHYKLDPGDRYPVPVKHTVLHAICDTGLTTTVRTVGYF